MNKISSLTNEAAADRVAPACDDRSGKSRSSKRKGRPAASARPPQSSLGQGQSTPAQRRAAAILEVLAGLRSASQAASTLGLSVNHYYLLERKALQGLVTACEPQPKGPAGPTAEQQVARLERELDRSRRDCLRQAALVRATQRAVGLPSGVPAKTKGKPDPHAPPNSPRKRRRPATVRALRAAQILRKNSSGSNPAPVVEPSLPEAAVTATDESRQEPQEPQDGTQGTQTAGHGACGAAVGIGVGQVAADDPAADAAR